MTLEQFIREYGYVGIFVAQFMTGIGLPPLPEEAVIILAGIACSQADLRWYVAWPLCIAGVVCADIVLYSIGYVWRQRLFEYRWVRRLLPPERKREIEDGFHKHGVKILLTGRLMPGLRTGVFMTAGAMHYPFLRFLIADAIYAIPGIGIVFFGSYFLTASFRLLVDEVHKVQWWLLVFLLLGAGGYVLYRYYQFRKERVSHNDFRPPSLPELMHPHASHVENAQTAKENHPEPAAAEQPSQAGPTSMP